MLYFIKDVFRQRGSFALVGDEGLVDVESLLEGDEGTTPLLGFWWLGIGRFDADKEPSLEVEDCIDVEEYLVDDIPRNGALLFEGLLQIIQVFEILDIFPFGVDQFAQDVISSTHLGPGRGGVGIVWVRRRLLEDTALCRKIQYMIDDLGDLEEIEAN